MSNATPSSSREIPELSPREAVERYIDKKEVSCRPATIQSIHYRLKQFVEWCEAEGIETIQELDGWDLETFVTHRRAQGLAPVTLSKQLITLKDFLEFCERAQLVEDDFPEKVDPPTVPKQKQSNDTRLAPEDALASIRHFRSSPGSFGKRGHLLLELAWNSGARLGAIRGLDLRDVDTDSQTIWFRHRPDTGTPLKNGPDGERPIAIGSTICDIIDRYIDEYRDDVTDEYGREPLITSTHGRPKNNSLRLWMNYATQPCTRGPCPHDKEPVSCEFRSFSQATKCPSSRSPHHVRTGAITWMRNQGFPTEALSKRVNSSVDVIEKHYDKEDPDVELEERRREYAGLLDVEAD